jgi:hypothetical protein
MRNSVIIVLSAIVLLAEALAAHAEVGGPVAPPTVGTANPPPPAAGSDVGTPPQKPADDLASGPIASGTDTSTAAPGGRAESSANGALSTPPSGKPVPPNRHKTNPARSAGDEAPK